MLPEKGETVISAVAPVPMPPVKGTLT